MSAPALAVRVSASIGELRAAMAAGRKEFASFGESAKKAFSQSGLRQFTTGLREGFQQAVAEHKKLQAATAKSPINSTQLKQVQTSFTGIGAALRTVLPPLAAFATILKTIKTSDNLRNLQAQLKRAAGDAEGAGVAFAALFDEAQKRGTSLEGLTKIYSELSDAARGSGTSQEALLQLTKAVNDALILSGKSAEDAAGALDILSLSMVTGTVSTQQLNTLYKQTPELVEALAKGTGKSIIELKKLAEQGKLTPKQLVEAMLVAKDDLAKAADALPLTFERAFEKIKNALLKMIGPFQTGLSFIAEQVGKLADFLSSDETIGAIEGFVFDVSNFFTQLWEVVSGAIDDIRRLFPEWVAESERDLGKFADAGKKAVAFVLDAFRNMPANIRAFVKLITVDFISLFEGLLALGRYFTDSFAAIFSDDTAVDAANRYRAELARIQKAREESHAITLDELQAAKDKSAIERQTALDASKAARAAAVAGRKRKVKVGDFGTPDNKKELAEAEKLRRAQIEADEKLEDDARKRALAQLEIFHERKLLTDEQFLDARAELELQSLAASRVIEERRLAMGGKDAIDAKANLEVIRRDEIAAVTKREEDKAKVRLAFAEQNKGLQADVLEAAGRDEEAALLRLQTAFDEQMLKLIASGNLAGAEIARALFDQNKFNLAFSSVKTKFDKELSSLNSQTEAIANQRIAGIISDASAETALRAAQERSLENMRLQVVALAEIAAGTKATADQKRDAAEAEAIYTQALIASATGVRKAIFDLRAQLKQLRDNFANLTTNAAVDAVTSLFTDLAEGTKTAKDALKDFVRGFAQSMLQIAARALATMLVLQALETFFPGAGRLVAAGGGVASGVTSHRGGIVGQATAHRRNVSPWVFAGAPRYHSGGIAGIAPNEQATILQKGEEVITAGDPRHANNGGQGSSVRVVNMIDAGNIHNAMASAGGERVIMNAIRANPGGVRQILSRG